MPNAAMRSTFERIIINQFTALHCAQARQMLDWSFEQLSQKSRVSVPPSSVLKLGSSIRDITRLALAYCLEAEGWCFFPGFSTRSRRR